MIENIISGNLSHIEFTPVADNCPATEVVGTITCTESGPKVSVLLCSPLDSVAVAPPETELILPEVQLLFLGSIAILSVDLAQQFASAAVETVLCIVRVGQIPHNLNMAHTCRYLRTANPVIDLFLLVEGREEAADAAALPAGERHQLGVGVGDAVARPRPLRAPRVLVNTTLRIYGETDGERLYLSNMSPCPLSIRKLRDTLFA